MLINILFAEYYLLLLARCYYHHIVCRIVYYVYYAEILKFEVALLTENNISCRCYSVLCQYKIALADWWMIGPVNIKFFFKKLDIAMDKALSESQW